jgi:hypothetical protein
MPHAKDEQAEQQHSHAGNDREPDEHFGVPSRSTGGDYSAEALRSESSIDRGGGVTPESN